MIMKKKTISLFIPHMGCPNDCVFCNQVKISGKDESFDYEEIVNILNNAYRTIPENYKIEIAFFGGSFTALDIEVQENLLKIADEFRKNIKNESLVKLSTRPDNINIKILDLLKKYDVDTIELGVQSMDDEVLLNSGRGHLSNCVYESSKLIKDYGFQLGIQLMIGLPFDNEEKLKTTIKKVIAIKPDIARLYPVLVIKDTELEKMYIKGRYKPLDVDEAVELTKKCYLALEKNDIKVIRVGLQNTKNINNKNDVISGPFHPAFGEKVKSLIIRDIIEDYVVVNKPTHLDIVINNKKVSQISGNKRENRNYFKEKYNLDMSIKANRDISDNQIVINNKKINII